MRMRSLLFMMATLTLTGTEVFSQNWQLVWADEFTNGISADWVFETGNGPNGWGNNELQYYRRENATVQNGQLVITAKNESYGGFNYTSVRMKTQGKKSWKYGKMEARIAMPAFQGAWPAFWMLGDNITSVGWPACGEIDVMEHINTGNTIYGTAHWAEPGNQHASYGNSTTTSAVTGYHIYTIEWDASFIKWFIDGVQYHVIDITNGINGTSELHNNFFVLLNFAIGGNWPGFTVDNSAFPANMYVDYVKVYQNNGTPPPPSTLIQAENYSAMSGVQTEATTDTGGGLNVGYIEAGDWMAYNNINFPTSGAYTVEYRVASVNGSRLSCDLNANAIPLGGIDIPATGGWQNWTTISQTVNVNAGTYNFGVYAQASGWNLNWIRITKQASAAVANLATESDVTSSFEVYPNPVVGNELNLLSEGNLSGSSIRILDRFGKQVLTAADGSVAIDVSSLGAGFYTLVLVKNGKVVTRHFVK